MITWHTYIHTYIATKYLYVVTDSCNQEVDCIIIFIAEITLLVYFSLIICNYVQKVIKNDVGYPLQ